MIDKIFATWWAICCGIGLVHFLFNQDENPWSIVGAILYFLLFLAMVYQIRAKQSVWVWIWKLHKKRQAWKNDPNNWSV